MCLYERWDIIKNKKNSFLIKLGDWIANIRYFSLVLFLLLTVFCFLNINNVSINDSIVSYLPNDTETKYGLELMDDEFGSLANIKLMIENINIDDAKEVATELSTINNVKEVLFDETENYYKNDKALYVIEIEELDDKELNQLKKDIENKITNNDYSIYSDEFEDPTNGIDKILVVACIVIVIVLLITSKTYFEPVIAFIIFGISIVLNMGSNFLFGEISYITKSIAVILQLALSIDYIIIFMNQYMKEISDTPDKNLALKKTISKSIPEIFASSLTTISGLLALVFMQLRIGGDIGLVLSKGILCSFLTVILVIPSLLSIFHKPIVKLKRKEKKVTKVSKIGNIIFNGRKVLLPLFIILIIISIFLLPKYNYVYNATTAKSISKSENIKSLEKIEEEFGKNNTLVILFKNNDKDYSKELKLVNELKDIKEISTITSIGGYEISDNIYLGTSINYLETSKIFNIDDNISLNLFKMYANVNNELDKLSNLDEYRITIIDMLYLLNANKDKLPLSQDMSFKLTIYYNLLNSKIPLLESDNYTRFILNLDVPIESEETRNTINKIRNVVKNNYDDVLLIGNSVNAIDLESSFTSDNLIITAVTIIFIALILIMTFKSFGMTILLISAIEGSILINFGLYALLGKEIFFMGYVVVTAIQMGATIDYAIVIASRYQELRHKMDKKDAIIQTLSDRLPAVITSGLILFVAGFLIGFISTSSVISQIGLFLGSGTLISLIITIFVLPAILYVCDKFIKKTTFGSKK